MHELFGDKTCIQYENSLIVKTPWQLQMNLNEINGAWTSSYAFVSSDIDSDRN